MGSETDIIGSHWSRAGVLFMVSPARKSPDIERLLLDTAREAHTDPRLAVMAVTWLIRYGELVAVHRLRRMIANEGSAEAVAALGLLLETATELGGSDFSLLAQTCRPACPAMPMFDVDRRTAGLARLMRSRASKLSIRWGLWTEPIETHFRALRPSHWVYAMNPQWRLRACFAGSLKQSILACLTHEKGAGESENELARRCGATRKAVHDALEHLEFCDLIRRSPAGRRYVIELAPRRSRSAI